MNESHLAQYTSLQNLTDFLKATHPPQSPGILKDEEYHAIALFVFTMNGRPLIEISPTQTPTFIPTGTPIVSQASNADSDFTPIIVIALLITLLVAVLLARRMRLT